MRKLVAFALSLENRKLLIKNNRSSQISSLISHIFYQKMNLFNVYSLLPFEPIKGQGSWIWDSAGNKYLDLYGGHAVISIGHQHPHQVQEMKAQLDKLSFYSNSVQNKLQERLAEKLGKMSGYETYNLFLTNSGAESNENALKLASFVTGRRKIISFKHSFHGRTSGAVAITDNPKIISPFNNGHEVAFVPLNDIEAFDLALDDKTAAVIIEGIQGVAGIHVPKSSFMQHVERKCKEKGALLILDEVQSGYGRTGKFFAHQYFGIQPDIITTAKGMGNGFPIGGVLIHPDIKPWAGMLGTTFGGNHLACVAAIAVLEVIEKMNLIANAHTMGSYLIEGLNGILGKVASHKIQNPKSEVRGMGLMIGFDVPTETPTLRNDLISKHKILTGEAKPNVIRLLPSLALTKQEVDIFLDAMVQQLKPEVVA
jgi:acetylornithine/N-succinyldiaminopimelate aminotransferase